MKQKKPKHAGDLTNYRVLILGGPHAGREGVCVGRSIEMKRISERTLLADLPENVVAFCEALRRWLLISRKRGFKDNAPSSNVIRA